MNEERAAAPQQETPVTTAAVADAVELEKAAVAPGAEPAEDLEYEPVETRTEVEVGLVRSVRIGPIMIISGILGAIVAAVAALFFPVAPDATYTVAQAAGFVALVGAAIGLFLGGVLSLILAQVAKRQSGAARAVLTDVR